MSVRKTNQQTVKETMSLLTTAQVAKRLQVSRGTVINWINANKLNHIVLPSGQFRIPITAIEEILTPIKPISSEVTSNHLPGQEKLL